MHEGVCFRRKNSEDDLRKRLWKRCSGYHERSLVETAIFRIKKMFGGELKARSMGAQATEVVFKCLAINKMNKLGMPEFEWILKAV